MSFLDKLSSLINISAPRLKALKILSENKIQVTVNKNDNRQINVNSGQLKKLIRDAVRKEGHLLLEETAQSTLQDFSNVTQKTIFKNTLEFFRGRIPPNDLEILRASLYIKDVHERGGSVRDLKWDIIQKYGVRGKNIANLCTAGYFESIIKPLYEEMSKQSDFILDNFLSTYNKIIDHYTFAVFVSNRMTKDDIKKEIIGKIEDNKKYGVKNMNIHGLGQSNVNKIFEVLNDTNIKKFFTQAPEIVSKNDYIIVKIWF